MREQEGRARQPTAAILDSQSVKTTDRGGIKRGFDAGKLIYGRKRHIGVDTLGLLLLVVVHAAGTPDRDGARTVLVPLAYSFSQLRKIWADGIYNGGLAEWVRNLRPRHRLVLEIVKRTDQLKGFVVLPRRWVVERTFAWLSFHRRMSAACGCAAAPQDRVDDACTQFGRDLAPLSPHHHQKSGEVR